MPALPLTVLRFSHAVNVGTFHAFRQSNISAYFYGKSVLRYLVRRLHGRIAVSQCARDFVSEYFPGDYRVIPNESTRPALAPRRSRWRATAMANSTCCSSAGSSSGRA